MKIKVNKNQFLDDWDVDYSNKCYRSGTSLTESANIYNFVEEDVTIEQLQEYINKGYGIKINCK